MSETCGVCGNDKFICQVCERIRCGCGVEAGARPSEWRPDITGHPGAGNVCSECFKEYEQARKAKEQVGWPRREVRRIAGREEAWDECEADREELFHEEMSRYAAEVDQRGDGPNPREEWPEWL